MGDIIQKKTIAATWFKELQEQICAAFEHADNEYLTKDFTPEHTHYHVSKNWQKGDTIKVNDSIDKSSKSFITKEWSYGTDCVNSHKYDGIQELKTGGGISKIMRGGLVFEKVGVNFSEVCGIFPEYFRKEMPGAVESNGKFWASGVSVVAHPLSPFFPSMHMNTRMIATSTAWFGGCADITPTFEIDEETIFFHNLMRQACEKYQPGCYVKFKEEADRYFFLPHRGEARGVGGIFCDYLDSGNWSHDLGFMQNIGMQFIEAINGLASRHINDAPWTEQDKQAQRIKRGRYVEFNLLWDRGTRFGLMSGGNTEAILMSLPPEVCWD